MKIVGRIKVATVFDFVSDARKSHTRLISSAQTGAQGEGN